MAGSARRLGVRRGELRGGGRAFDLVRDHRRLQLLQLVLDHVSVAQVGEFLVGAAALVGAPAVVLQRVDADGGLVRIGGEDWSARAYMPDQVLEPGAKVEVAEISGATALVYE